MSAMIGHTLGHYTIVEKIGAGAMGEVFRARDQRLERDVALKVLPAGTLADETARHRFRREALALSRLNHPNIETVYDFDTQDNIDFLVMEFVAGRTLSDLVNEREMTEKELKKIGVQLAMALEEAHEKGVVHRDLKPANIVITPKGQVKVLDFGLAELLGTVETGQGSTRTATMPAGTLRYMAPEVLQGRPADLRSDIWSLGVVLFELACGKPPFQGMTVYELTSAIVRQEPESLPPLISPPLRTVIQNCLAKRPEQRYQHAGEVRASLEALLSDSSVGTLAMVPPLRRRRRLWFAMATAVVLVAAAGLWKMQLFSGGGQQSPYTGGQLTMLLSSEAALQDPSLSPDGKTIVYVAEEQGQFDLYAARLASGGRVRLTNDGRPKSNPVFSPDGERVAFTRLLPGSDGPEIAVVATLGGEATPLIANASSPGWSPDGKKLAYLTARPGEPMALVTAALDGSGEQVLLTSDATYPFLREPAWSPDGKYVAVGRSTGGVAGEIYLIPAAGGAAQRVGTNPSGVFAHAPVFTADSKAIVYSSNRGGATNLWMVRLDGKALVQLTTGPGPDEHPTISRDNTIAFLNSRWRHELKVQPAIGGSSRTLVKHSTYIWAPTFSPDGREIVFSRYEPDGLWHLWSVSVEGGAARQLTSGADGEIYGRLVPDGSAIVYHSWAKGGPIYSVPRSGGLPRQLTHGNADQYGDVSPDGRQLAFVRTEHGQTRLYVTPIGGEPRLLTQTSGALPRWSPDGKWILFSPDRSVRGGVFIIGADGQHEHRLTQTGGWSFWWHDSRTIGYIGTADDGTQKLLTVSADGGNSKTIAFMRWTGSNNPVDVSADGKLLATSDSTHLSDDIWFLRPANPR